MFSRGGGLFQSCTDSYTESRSVMLSDGKDVTESYHEDLLQLKY